MKKIILLEDQPNKLGSLIKEIQRNFAERAEVNRILCYGDTWKQEEMEQLKKQLTRCCDMKNIQCEKVDIWNFDLVMDKYYKDKNTGFIFDTQIYPGEDVDVFDYRININYALQVPEDDNRIWFYTLAGQYYESNIRSRFEGHVIGAEAEENGIVLRLDECESFMEWIMGE